jgi:hypothetical protein
MPCGLAEKVALFLNGLYGKSKWNERIEIKTWRCFHDIFKPLLNGKNSRKNAKRRLNNAKKIQ